MTHTGDFMTFRSLTVVAILALLGGAPALGAEPAPVSDAELKSFAGIVLEVRRIADNYNSKRDAAQTVREQQKVELAASDELARAVTQEGMTVERYQEIMKQTLSNPDLSARVKQAIKQKQR